MGFMLRLFGFILTVLLGTSAYAEGFVVPEPVLLGPTTFSTFSQNSFADFGYDLVYLKNDVNPKLRRLAEITCGSTNSFIARTYLWIGYALGVQHDLLPAYSTQSCAESGPHQLRFSEPLVNTEFDRWDHKVIAQINRTFYKEIRKFGTLSLQHGHPTETVYVYLPGLYMNGKQFLYEAAAEFWHGSNVILGTLPGHQNEGMIASENDIGSWLTYTDFLISIARHYGKKVVVVGQSTGGTLAVRAAEAGRVDRLILFQPFFGLNKVMTAVMAFGQILPEFLLNSKVQTYNVLDTLKIGIEDQRLLIGSFQKIPATLPVDLIVADNDSIVSTAASLRWAKEFAPHSRIVHHTEDHMYVKDPSK